MLVVLGTGVYRLRLVEIEVVEHINLIWAFSK